MNAAHGSTSASAATTTRVTAARATTSVGMAIALGALAMCFAALLLGYAILRAQAETWPPPNEPPVPRSWPWLLGATIAAVAGSGAMRAATRTLGESTTAGSRRMKVLLIAAAIAGATFLAVQVAGWLWLSRSGIRPSSGLVASVVYALTLFHALHALAALMALLPVLVLALRGKVVPAAHLGAVSSFWHLVTIVWLVVLFAVFVA